MKKYTTLLSKLILSAAVVGSSNQWTYAATTTPFIYHVDNWSTQPSPMQYVASNTNMRIWTESHNNLDFWAASSAGSASLVLHFDLNLISDSSDYEIERAALYVPVSLFSWYDPDPTGVLSVSTNGTDWIELDRATPTSAPAYGFTYGTYTAGSGVVPALLPQVVGASNIWLRFDMTNIGSANTAQWGRSIFGDERPAFLLEVNVEPVPEPSAPVLLMLASLSLTLRHRR